MALCYRVSQVLDFLFGVPRFQFGRTGFALWTCVFLWACVACIIRGKTYVESMATMFFSIAGLRPFIGRTIGILVRLILNSASQGFGFVMSLWSIPIFPVLSCSILELPTWAKLHILTRIMRHQSYAHWVFFPVRPVWITVHWEGNLSYKRLF